MKFNTLCLKFNNFPQSLVLMYSTIPILEIFHKAYVTFSLVKHKKNTTFCLPPCAYNLYVVPS